jgi:pimeloyl-ACP methyl ester carboxylesterase
MTDRVVLLHGLWMPGMAMHWLAARLRAAGFKTEIFAYPSIAGGPEQAVPRLVEVLRRGPAHIVAHSLGGMVALQALCEAPDLDVPRMVCLGVPLKGSGAAASLQHWPVLSLMLGRSAQRLQSGFPCWEGRTELGMIAGRIPHGLGALFAQFTEEHDGTVAVAETQLDGLADHVVVPASHSGLLFSEEVARQAAAFLREGRFGAK